MYRRRNIVRERLLLIYRGCLTILLLFGHCCGSVLAGRMSEGEKQQTYPLNIRLVVGASLTSGNTSTRTATLDFEVYKRYSRFQLRLTGKGAYGESSYADGPWIESTNNWRVSSRVDWFTTSQLHSFMFAEGSVHSNQYRGFWLRNSVQGGYGIRLFASDDKVDVSIPLGIDYARDVLVVDNGQKPENFSVVLKPEIVLRFNSQIQYRKRSNVFLNLQDGEDYRIDTEHTVDMKISDSFAFRLSHTLCYYHKPRLIREVDQSGKQTGQRVPAKPTDHLFAMSLLISL